MKFFCLGLKILMARRVFFLPFIFFYHFVGGVGGVFS
jgi:hypothetical protein